MATPIPENRWAVTLADVLASTGGAAPGAALETTFRGVVTDTRHDCAGKLFVALSGERFDGHAFVPRALEQGAAGVLVRRGAVTPAGAVVVTVEDTLSALGALGGLARARWGGTLVAVGGSAGKTTTRAAVAAALEAVAPGAVYSLRGNLNNRIGVPHALFGLGPQHQVAVIEVGTNQPGEVAALGRVTAPDVALLTLVELEHAEGLGDLDAVEREEGDLFRALGAAGAALANGDDERARRQLSLAPAARRATWGLGASADYRVTERTPLGVQRSRVTVARPAGPPVTLEASLLGVPGALALAAAVAAAEAVAGCALPAEALVAALSAPDLGEPGRLTPLTLRDGTVVLDDSYNSNPGSARASIAAASELARARGARLVLVLGEMRELGAASAAEHRALAGAVQASGAAALIGVSGDAALLVAAVSAAGGVASFAADAEAAAPLVAGAVGPGDVVLVKASRGVRAERLVNALVARSGRAA